ncbi:MAG: hypothetical protein V4671_00600 [Armatimonadota bacterium]
MTNTNWVHNFKKTLRRPVGWGSVLSCAGVICLVLAAVFPTNRLFLFSSSLLLPAAALVQRREAGLWPFRVPIVENVVERRIVPALRIIYRFATIAFWIFGTVSTVATGIIYLNQIVRFLCEQARLMLGAP